MNKDNNERFKETEEKILKAYAALAFSKSISKITVSDICQEAQIHRTTFYGHFQDMPDLESKIIGIQFKNMLQEFITADGWNFREGILAQLNFYYNYQAMVKRNYSTASYDSMEKVFTDIVSTQYLEPYKKHFGLENDLEVAYHQCYLGTGFISIVKKWVDNGCKESPEYIADLICKITGQ